MNNTNYHPQRNNLGNNQQQQKQQKEIFTFETGKGQDFRSLVDGDIKLLSNVSRMISNFFVYIYKDFDGAVIRVNNQAPEGFDVELHFSYKNNADSRIGVTSAFELNDQHKIGPNASIMDKIAIFQNTRKPTNVYKLTNDGKEGIAKYIRGFDPKTASDRDMNGEWNKVTMELVSQNSIGQPITTVCIKNISISLILRDIFGKFVDKEEVQYLMLPINPLNPQFQNQQIPNIAHDNAYSDWMVLIYRINVANLNKVLSEVGKSPVNNGIAGLVSPTISPIQR